MRNYFLKTILSLVLFTITLYIADGQQYGWRGPGRTGVYNETGLMKTWPSSGPSLLWEATGISLAIQVLQLLMMQFILLEKKVKKMF